MRECLDRCVERLREHFEANRPGRVACVVGGSSDMRYIRHKLWRSLRELNVRIQIYHSELLFDDGLVEFSKLLLLITETLYATECCGLRRSMQVVFDMCECHRMRQGLKGAGPEGYGWCDILETLPITQQMGRKRQLTARSDGQVYRPLESHLPWDHGDEMPWRDRYWHAPHGFLEFPLPDTYPNRWRIDRLLRGTWPPRETSSFRWRNAPLSFNSLPLGNLLSDAVQQHPRHGSAAGQRMAMLLLVCAAQLTAGAAFAPLFQSTRHLISSRPQVWKLVEAGCSLRGFLSSGGRTSVVVGLAALALQNVGQLSDIMVDALETIDGLAFRDFCDLLPPRASSALPLLLREVMWTMGEYLDTLLANLANWAWMPPGYTIPTVDDAARAPAAPMRDVVRFLEGVSCQAVTKSNGDERAPCGFTFDINPYDEARGFECTQPILHYVPPQGFTIPDATRLDRLDSVLNKYGCCTRWDATGGATLWQRVSRRGGVYVLLIALDVYFHLADLDRSTDEWDSDEEEPHIDNESRDACENIKSTDKHLDVHLATRPLWLLNPATHPENSTAGPMAVYALKRHVLPDRMFLTCTVLGPARRQLGDAAAG